MTALLGPVRPVAAGALSAARPARAGAPPGRGFGALLAGSGVTAAEPPRLVPVTAPSGLPLGLDPEAGRRAARQRLAALLVELERLQRGLLAGRIEQAGLERLAALAAAVEVTEPGLAELAADIALRARIELARLAVVAPR